MRPKHTAEPPANTTITQCTNCNGDLTYNPAAQTLDCPFCNSSYTLTGEAVKSEATVMEAPRLIIPFAFAKEVFDKAAMEWLSLDDYTPADVLDVFRSNVTQGVYVSLNVWNVDYVITDPMGNKANKTVVIDVPQDVQKWPAELNEFAKTTVLKKGNTKPFDKVYTLGFEILEDEVADADSFNRNVQALAMQTIVRQNYLKDSKTVVINNMSLTRVLLPFWINSFKWQDQRCEVIMSGFEVTRLAGTRPVDKDAQSKNRPSFKLTAWSLLAGLLILIIGVITSAKGHSSTAFNVISMILLVFITPALFFITLIRVAMWKDPRLHLAHVRAEKLAERLKLNTL